MRGWVRQRCLDRLQRLSGSELDVDSLRLEMIDALRRCVGFDVWGFPLVDPKTLIPYRPLVSDPPPWGGRLPERWMLDQSTSEINARSALVDARQHVGVLSAATHGDLARCFRWRELGRPSGMGDELRAAVVDRHVCWGSLELFRGSDDPPFGSDDASLMSVAAASLAPALRRASVRTSGAPARRTPRATGVVVIGRDLRLSALTDSAAAWISLMNAPVSGEPTVLPIAVYETVARLVARESGEDEHRPPQVRARINSGEWAVVEAARLDDTSVAVTIRETSPRELLDLLALVHALTRRERQLVELVAAGLETQQIAHRLFISSNTARDHLKSVFLKMGLHSRRELLAGLMVDVEG